MSNESASAVTRGAETREVEEALEQLRVWSSDKHAARYVEIIRAALLRSSVRGASEVDAREIVLRHRRHVEQSPGVGPRVRGYAIDVLDDVLRDLPAAPRSTEETRPSNVATCGCYYDGTVIYCAEHRGARTGAEGAGFNESTKLGQWQAWITNDHSQVKARVAASEASIAAHESRKGR